MFFHSATSKCCTLFNKSNQLSTIGVGSIANLRSGNGSAIVRKLVNSNLRDNNVKIQEEEESFPQWNVDVFEAEKVLGFSTSFLNLQSLVNENKSILKTSGIENKVGSKHPVWTIFRSSLTNGYNGSTSNTGLIVLLFSKAAGIFHLDKSEEDKTVGVLHSQRVLAEAAEMIRTSFLLHKSVVNIDTEHLESTSLNDIKFGNKIALISGDYLLAIGFEKLASLRNFKVNELMYRTLHYLAEGEFFGRRDNQNKPLPPAPPSTGAIEYWTQMHIYSSAFLLGNSCHATLNLAGHGEDLQRQGFKFGKHFALACQVSSDLEPFTVSSPDTTGSLFSLTCAPILFHLEKDSTLFGEINKGLESVRNIDYEKVHSVVSKGPGIELAQQLLNEHTRKAMEILLAFPDSDSRTVLMNIMQAVAKL